MWGGGGGGSAGRVGASMVLARGGVPFGCESAAFGLAELDAALDALDARSTACTIMVEREGSRLAARGGASAALAAAAARPAPHRLATGVLLSARPCATGWLLALRTARPLAPLDELLVWPDAPLAALAGVPPLAPADIRGDVYRCGACGATFDQPNPLKVHRYLRCAPTPPAPRAFLRRLLQALALVPPPYTPAPAPAGATAPERAGREGAAALEALCTAWGAQTGGGRAGHVCVYCGRAYSRRYGLKIHIRTHTGYKPLRCPHCARRFGDPSNLNKHVRLHVAHAHAHARGARHQCSRCGLQAARRRDLARHARTQHPAPSPSPSPSPAPG